MRQGNLTAAKTLAFRDLQQAGKKAFYKIITKKPPQQQVNNSRHDNLSSLRQFLTWQNPAPVIIGTFLISCSSLSSPGCPASLLNHLPKKLWLKRNVSTGQGAVQSGIFSIRPKTEPPRRNQTHPLLPAKKYLPPLSGKNLSSRIGCQ